MIVQDLPGDAWLLPADLTGDHSASEASVVIGGTGQYGPIVAPGDMTGDGVDDVIFGTPYDTYGSTTVGGAYLLAGPLTTMDVEDGEAQFEDPASGVEYLGSRVSAAGDVTGDGLADVYAGSYSGQVFLLPGGVSGAYDVTASPTIYEGDYFGRQGLVSADFDGDGVVDMATGGTDHVYLFLGPPPSGTVSYTSADGRIDMPAYQMGAGDLNDDGTADLVVDGSTYDGTYAFFAAPSGDVSYTTADWSFSYGGVAHPATQVVGTDLDGDGVGDIVVGTNFSGACGWYGPLAGTDDYSSVDFLAYGTYPSGADYGYIQGTVDDVTGDGVSELLLANYGNDDDESNGGAVFIL